MGMDFRGYVVSESGDSVIRARRIPKPKMAVGSEIVQRRVVRAQAAENALVAEIDRRFAADARIALFERYAGECTGEARKYWKGLVRLGRKLRAAGKAGDVLALGRPE